MTLKDNRAPLLTHQALCIISSPYVNSNWSYGRETAKWGQDLCDLDLWPLTLTFCMDITSVNGSNSWKFQDDTMTGTLSKGCDGRTDGQTGRQTDGQTEIGVLTAAWSQLKISSMNYFSVLRSLCNIATCRCTFPRAFWILGSNCGMVWGSRSFSMRLLIN